MIEFITAYLGLGSNLGDRQLMIESAFKALDHVENIKLVSTSHLHETEPIGPGMQGLYLNAAIKIQTTLRPRQLLETILEIERSLGRDRAQEERWGPRTLDIDLLLYGDLVLDEQGLQIPHPMMQERGFVLIPLAEIAAQTRHPILNQSIQEMVDRLAIKLKGE